MAVIASSKLITKKTKAGETLPCIVKYSYGDCKISSQFHKFLNWSYTIIYNSTPAQFVSRKFLGIWIY